MARMEQVTESRTMIDREFRRDAYRDLLAWCILAFRTPTAEGLSQLQTNDPRGLLERAGIEDGRIGELSGQWRATDRGRLLADLQEEHVRLFVASKESRVAHPEALAYLDDDEDRARFLADLDQEMSRLGLVRGPGEPAPADHLTVLLELLYARDIAGVGSIGDSFCSRFFGGWVPRFLSLLAVAAPGPFYRDAAVVLQCVLGLETSNDDPGGTSENEEDPGRG